ncbi:hypothetical protein ACWCO0_13240 [Streptomyces tubercidicus]|uniref:Secreted protein n=1 Tax=Streptomyces tubercidicus TaxID=47759 RepID=A0A640UUV7_9ACTN|nr:hypothetical protein [Streptomyces tubercidicus]WAU13579.1 hypothetical protein STRTU_004094 [Streptomyces tubercidicus]GFE39200.1 hypothetical protein Stube_38730 [Streptomyces tubercidicus]
MSRFTRTLVTVALAAAAAGVAATPAMADSHTPATPGFSAQDSTMPIAANTATPDNHIPAPHQVSAQH